ncbi:hypothetical protein Tco_1219302 [Tanacetum coccineum]
MIITNSVGCLANSNARTLIQSLLHLFDLKRQDDEALRGGWCRSRLIVSNALVFPNLMGQDIYDYYHKCLIRWQGWSQGTASGPPDLFRIEVNNVALWIWAVGDKIPKATTTDISLTKYYRPKVSKIPGISPTIAQFYKPIENRNIHEGRVVDQAYYKSNNIERLFTNIRFNCLFQINKPIVPRFILDFYSQVTGPYCTDLPTPDDICQLLELERVMVDRTIKSQMVSLNPNQILTKELSPDMMQWEELIRENVFGLGGHQDHLPACLAHMLYGVVAEEQYNLAYFFIKRIQCARYTLTANLLYGMFLTIMRPLALKQTRRPRSDLGKARHSVSSSSLHQGMSSHQHNDDDDDDNAQTSRASTPSPTTYLNSLDPLNYQNYQMPSASEQTDETLFERQTALLNQTQQMHKEMRGGFKSFGKALKGVFSKKKK